MDFLHSANTRDDAPNVKAEENRTTDFRIVVNPVLKEKRLLNCKDKIFVYTTSVVYKTHGV